MSALLIFISTVLAQTVDLPLKNVEEFQFVHCMQTAQDDSDVLHFVIDTRDENRHVMYRGEAKKTAKASQIGNLALIDSNLEVNASENVDVSWFSRSTNTLLELIIMDNGGYSMQGDLTQNGVKTPVFCLDVSLE